MEGWEFKLQLQDQFILGVNLIKLNTHNLQAGRQTLTPQTILNP